MGWKWSVASERHGIPLGWAIDGANRNDGRMLEPALGAVADAGLLADIGTPHLDRSDDSGAVRDRLRAAGLDQFEIQLRGTRVSGVKKQPVRLGLRWTVEATNTWWSNYGQLRRNTGRRVRHRHAALCLATTVLIVGPLIDWRDRWSPRDAYPLESLVADAASPPQVPKEGSDGVSVGTDDFSETRATPAR